MSLRPELEPVLQQLLRSSQAGSAIPLDEIGEALGTLAVSTEEIGTLFAQLEGHGRSVQAPIGGGGEASLRRVIAAARALKNEARELSPEASPRPTLRAVAERAQLSREDVIGALYLLRIMQQG